MRVSIVLVDDHRVVRGGLRSVFDAEPDMEVVGEADTLADGIAVMRVARPDVLVCDVTLRDGNGLDLVREARSQRPELGIVVLTMHGDDETLLGALDAGASALVLKSAHLEDVLSAVRQAAASPEVFAAAGLAGALRRSRENSRPQLTQREQDVLNLLVDGMSVAETAGRLYLSESTVKTHIAKLYDKLGATNRAQAVMAALRQGLLRQPV
jgi:DNA-binding NarL/FixJ family response regulator